MYPARPASKRVRVVNSWINAKKERIEIVHTRTANGIRASVIKVPPYDSAKARVSFMLATQHASVHYRLKAERKALARLSKLITRDEYREYYITGVLWVFSKRSGLTYIIRRGRPTVVISTSRGKEHAKILGALCVHAEGYYAGTWAGALVPTDDAIYHLIKIRGDEYYFWRVATFHPPDQIESGI